MHVSPKTISDGGWFLSSALTAISGFPSFLAYKLRQCIRSYGSFGSTQLTHETVRDARQRQKSYTMRTMPSRLEKELVVVAGKAHIGKAESEHATVILP